MRGRIILARVVALIAALALLVLAGCSSIRLSYDNAPRLTWWWLDGYVDFSSEQAPPVKTAIDDFYAWHRQTQLPSYAALLAELRAPLLQSTTAAAVCRWQKQIQTALEPAAERALKAVADSLPPLSEAEFEHIAQRYEKNNADFRKDYLQPDPKRRAEAAFERAEGRAKSIYGRLDAAQQAVIREHVARVGFDPALSLAERQRRQRDTIATLRRLQSENAGPERRLNALRGLAERAQSSPDLAYREHQIRLREDNCAFFARLHNAGTAVQRAKARETVDGYVADLRSLALE